MRTEEEIRERAEGMIRLLEHREETDDKLLAIDAWISIRELKWVLDEEEKR